MIYKLIHLFHGLFIAPLLIVLAFFIRSNKPIVKDNEGNEIYNKNMVTLVIIACIVFLINIFKLTFPSRFC
jgi:uncharacterized membrane protein